MASDLSKKYYGLDVSDRAVRIVEFAKRGKKIFLKKMDENKLPKDIIISGEIKNPEKLVEKINELFNKAGVKSSQSKNVITVLPETKTFIKLIEIPTPEKNQRIAELINEEIKKHIPMDPETLYLDWQVIRQQGSQAKILVGAAPKDIVNNFTQILEKCNIIPHIMEVEAAPIIRSLVTDENINTKIIIDFGANRTGLIICEGEVPQFTVSLPISGNKITDQITETLKIDRKKAEKAKIVCGLNDKKCEGALLKLLMDPINDLAKEIKKAASYYQENFSEPKKISEIILCGGGAYLIDLDKILYAKIGIPVKIGDPLTKVIPYNKLKVEKNKILSFTTAIGLLLRVYLK